MDLRVVDHVNQLLLQFAALNGLPPVALGEQATCTLEHPDGVSIHLELSADGAMLHWYSRVCEVPAQNRVAFYERLLEMNLLGLQTRGGVLGLEPGERQVVLSCQQPAWTLDLTSLTNVTENFLVTALELSATLTRTDTADPPETEPPAAEAEPEMRNVLQMRV